MLRTQFEKMASAFYHSLFARFQKYFCDYESRWVEKQLVEAGIKNVDLIHSYTEKAELVTLYHLASSCPPNSFALEIGSYLGASTCYLAAGLSQVGGHLYCVDIWNNETMPEGRRDTLSNFLKNTCSIHHLITPIRKRSSELSIKEIQTPLNFVFIDGDHCYEAVKSDFALVKGWLAENGIIAFHDFAAIDHEGVTRVLGEALASGDWVLSGLVDTLAWIKPAKWSQPYRPTEA